MTSFHRAIFKFTVKVVGILYICLIVTLLFCVHMCMCTCDSMVHIHTYTFVCSFRQLQKIKKKNVKRNDSVEIVHGVAMDIFIFICKE